MLRCAGKHRIFPPYCWKSHWVVNKNKLYVLQFIILNSLPVSSLPDVSVCFRLNSGPLTNFLPCFLPGGVWERFQGGRGSGYLCPRGVLCVLVVVWRYQVRDKVVMSWWEFAVAICPHFGHPTLKGLSRESYVGLFSWWLCSFLKVVQRLLWEGREEACEVTLKQVLSVYLTWAAIFSHLRSIFLWSRS